MGDLRENFSMYELECKCGCIDMRFCDEDLDDLQALRDDCGFPFHINSGYRCPSYNAKVSSTGFDGPHTDFAVDIGITGAKAIKFLTTAPKHGFNGIGVSQKGPHKDRFIHIDKGRVRLWSY